MITEPLTVRGVKLDIQHDGEVIHCVETHSGQEDIYPLLDACVIAELRALLFGKETAIVEPVYEVGWKHMAKAMDMVFDAMNKSPTLAEVNARRGFPEKDK